MSMEALGICFLSEGSGVAQSPSTARELLMRANTRKYGPNTPPPMDKCVRQYHGRNRGRVRLCSALDMCDMWEAAEGPGLGASAPASWRQTWARY